MVPISLYEHLANSISRSNTQNSEDEKNPASPCELSIRFPNEETKIAFLKMKKDREDKQRKLQKQEKRIKQEKRFKEKENIARSEKMLEEKVQNNIKGSVVEIESSESISEDFLGKRKISSLALENTENEDSNATKAQELSMHNNNKKLKVETPKTIESSNENKDSPQNNLDKEFKIKKIKEMVTILDFL